jgi:hypothetical protein
MPGDEPTLEPTSAAVGADIVAFDPSTPIERTRYEAVPLHDQPPILEGHEHVNQKSGARATSPSRA